MFPKVLPISSMNMAHRHTLGSPLCRLFFPLSQHMSTKVPPSPAKPTSPSSLISENTTNEKDQSYSRGVPTQKLSMNTKRYILLAFKHKSVAEVPDVLTVVQIDALYQRARITVNLLLGLVVVILCIIAIATGKLRAARGESLDKINRDWHRQNMEEHRAKEAAKFENSAPSH